MDEIDVSGPPDTVVIRSKSSDTRSSAKTTRSGSWENLSLSSIVADITQRVAAFLAQIGHESGHLRYVREIWGPRRHKAATRAGPTWATPSRTMAINTEGVA